MLRLFVIMLLCSTTPALAGDKTAEPKADVTSTTEGGGHMNWSRLSLAAVGRGRVPFKAVSPNSARAAAQARAEIAVQEALLTGLGDLPVQAELRVKDLPAGKDTLAPATKNFAIEETRFYADGSVDMFALLDLRGEIQSHLTETIPGIAKDPVVDPKVVLQTAVVTVKDLEITPSLAPRLFNNQRQIHWQSKDDLPIYVRSIERAKREARGQVLMLHAQAVTNQTDVQLLGEEAANLQKALDENRLQGIILVVD